jgi:hypothetical protein
MTRTWKQLRIRLLHVRKSARNTSWLSIRSLSEVFFVRLTVSYNRSRDCQLHAGCNDGCTPNNLPERACVLPELHREQWHPILVRSHRCPVTVSFTSCPVHIRGVDRGEGKQFRTDFDKHNEL